MDDSVIVGLAALGGALIGGLTTVWATHKTNRAAAEREREQREHDRQRQTHAEAQTAVADLLGAWLDAIYAAAGHKVSDADASGVRRAAARVGILLPALEDHTGALLTAAAQELRPKVLAEVRSSFHSAAMAELDKIKPTS